MKGYDIGPNEEIRTFTWGEDATIGTKAVLLHHVFVSHRVADINVGPKWKCHHRRVKVNDIYMLLILLIRNVFATWCLWAPRWWHWHSWLVLTSTTQCGTIGPNEGFHYWDQDRTPSSRPHIYRTASWISMLAPNSRVFTEGSRLTTYSWSETYIF